MAYTHAGLTIKQEEFDASTRFITQYGLPLGRPSLSDVSIDSKYRIKRSLDPGQANGGTGALNEGVDLAVKRTSFKKGKLYVLKRIGFSPAVVAILKREVEILHVLKHPNIVRFVDGFIPSGPSGQAQLVVEWCDRGSLGDLMKRYRMYNDVHPNRSNTYLPEGFLWHIFESLISALAYLHHGVQGDDLINPCSPRERGDWPRILHRDIKPENVFLHSLPADARPHVESRREFFSHVLSDEANKHPRSSYGKVLASVSEHFVTSVSNDRAQNSVATSTYPRVILADFGVCTQENEPDWKNETTCAGTVHWMSPELPDMTARGEVWAVTAVVLSLARLFQHGPIGRRPNHFRGDDNDWYHSKAARKGIRKMDPGDQYSDELCRMLGDGLRFKAEHRLLSHLLLDKIRTRRANMDLEFQPLPTWAFSTS